MILDWLKAYNLAGTWADVAGIIGFAVTIWAALTAKSAASKALAAAEKTRESIRLFDTVVDVQAIIQGLEDIKRLHRDADWKLLPERYASVRKQLIIIRESESNLDDHHLEAIQATVNSLSDMERNLEGALKRGANPKGSDKLNPILSENNDALISLLQALKNRAGTNGIR